MQGCLTKRPTPGLGQGFALRSSTEICGGMILQVTILMIYAYSMPAG